YRLDVAPVRQVLAIDARDDPVAVEPDDIDLLVQHVGAEKRELLRLAADVEPALVVKHAGARRRPQDLDDLLARRRSRLNLGELVGLGQIAALVDGGAASGDGGDRHRQYRKPGAAPKRSGAVFDRLG